MTIRRGLALALSLSSLFIVSGCASPEPQPVDAHASVRAEAQADVCKREYRVGSNIPTKNCTAPMTEEERQRMIDELRNKTRPFSPQKASTGG